MICQVPFCSEMVYEELLQQALLALGPDMYMYTAAYACLLVYAQLLQNALLVPQTGNVHYQITAAHACLLVYAELLQEALLAENAAGNGLTASGLAALFAEAWFPSLTPGYGAAGQLLLTVVLVVIL